MPMHSIILLISVVVLLVLPCSAQDGVSYLGCFNLPRMLYLKGVEGVKATHYKRNTIQSCFSTCSDLGYSINIITTEYKCWCALATPDMGARMDESACSHGSKKGVLVFYRYNGR